MTMKAKIVNCGNCDGDRLLVQQGERTHSLRRGESVEVDAPHGRESEPIVLTAGDSMGDYAGEPQLTVTDPPRGATR